MDRKQISDEEDASFGADRLQRPGDAPTGVRRVNNMPLLIVGAVLVVFLVLVVMVASKRSSRGKAAEPSSTSVSVSEHSQLLDQMLANSATGGLVPDPDEAQLQSFRVARVEDPDLPPRPVVADSVRSAADGEVAKERMKLFQTAMHARTGIAKLSEKDVPARVESEKAEQEPVKPSAISPGLGLGQQTPIVADGDYSKFDQKPSKSRKDRWLLGSEVEEPVTAYQVRTGAVIPATMISGINSEIPGQIIAQVSQDVFDTATGRHRLIPQGSRLVGRYNHNVVMGQSRLLVAWQRVVFPDGKALDIGAMEGSDMAGYAGFNDKVDRHYLRLFGSAILMSGIMSGLTSSRVNPNNDPFGSSNEARLSQNLAQQIGEVATKMIEQNMNIAPTLEIRPGYRFNVMVVKDLTLKKPYRPFDY